MINDASGFKKVYIATGFTDLRRGIEGFSSLIKFQFRLDSFQKTFSFCSVVNAPTELKGLSGKGMVFCFFTNV